MYRSTFAATACSALILLAIAASLALAQEPVACGDEIEKFCSHVTPGKLSMTDCLNENRARLSGECLAKVDKALVKINAAKKICGGDIAKFCTGVKPGEGRILNCLNIRLPELTPDCRKQLERHTGKKEKQDNNLPKGK